MPPRQASTARRTKKKPLGPRALAAAEGARLADELYAKLNPEGPIAPSVPLDAFDAETGWFDPPPKQETPRQTLRRFMRVRY